MPSIQITDSGTYAVHYSVFGKQKKKTFKTKNEAKKFLAYITLNPEQRQSSITAAAVLTQYLETESKKKKSAKSEQYRIGRYLRSPWASKPVEKITTRELQAWLDGRVLDKGASAGSSLSDGTLIREGSNLKGIFAWAMRMDLTATNPFKDLKLPKEPDHRERTASAEDIEALKVASGWDGEEPIGNELHLVVCAFLFACQTGMRSGEVLKMEEQWIEGRVVHIPKESTKTDAHRDVALSAEAMRLLDLARAFTNDVKIFGAAFNDSLRDALFRKVRDRANLGAVTDSEGRVIKEGLHFHDSRATFCTWAASPDPKTGAPRLELLALARQTGHKDLKNLMKYYRATAASLASRLD